MNRATWQTLPVTILAASFLIQTCAAYPVRPKVDTEKEARAAMQHAEWLRARGKFDDAQKIYGDVVAKHPQGELAYHAKNGSATTYLLAHKPREAIAILEQMWADRKVLPVTASTEIPAMIADVKRQIAAEKVKAKDYAGAVATLRQIVDDKRSSSKDVRAASRDIAEPQLYAAAIASLRKTADDKHSTLAYVHGALREIAETQAAAGKPADAIATYRAMMAGHFGELAWLDDLRSLVKLDPAALGQYDSYVKSHWMAPTTYLAKAYYEKAEASLRLKRDKEAVAAFDGALASRGLSFEQVRQSLIGKAEAQLLLNDRAGAIATYRELVGWPDEPRRPANPSTRLEAAYTARQRLEDLDRLMSVVPSWDAASGVALYLESRDGSA